jgi:quinol monooxygenase YgiN
MKVFEAFVTLSIGIFAGFIINDLIVNGANKKQIVSTNSIRESKHKAAFFLAITIKFVSADVKQKFMGLFGPFAKYIAEVEPGTISFELSESDKTPLQIFLVERYVNKEAYIDIHRKTDTFIAFRAKITELGASVTMDGHSYIESNLGFM